jgi:hypothetical protein
MNAKDALKKISEMLNLHFKKEKFFTTSLVDGTEVTNNMEEDFKIGQELFIVNETTLSPAPAGKHETRDGVIITTDESSVIIAIESGDDADDSTEEQEMTVAEDAQGQKLESNTFDVGEEVFLIKEDGTKEKAPDGEHQVVLKDESGNENKIRIQVKDGVITERANIEEQDMMVDPEVVENLIDALVPMIEEVKALTEEMKKMKTKMSSEINKLRSDFNSFKKSPEKFSVNEKKTVKENFDDYKLELIKSLRR